MSVCLSKSICLAVGLFAYISHFLTFVHIFFFFFISFLPQNPFFSPQGLILDHKLNSETSKRSILREGIRNYKNTTHPQTHLSNYSKAQQNCIRVQHRLNGAGKFKNELPISLPQTLEKTVALGYIMSVL